MNTKDLVKFSLFVFFLTALLLVGTAACGFLLAREVSASNEENPPQVQAHDQQVSPQDHVINNEDTPEVHDLVQADNPVEPVVSDEDAILTALAAHFEMDENDFSRFEVEENTGNHAKGTVDNGYFLVAKVSGEWIFVDGGQSWPDCNKVANYGFPASMVPSCQPSESRAPSCSREGSNVATFITDVTIPDGSKIEAGQEFIKTWRIQNVGSCTWTPEYRLIYFGGDLMGGPDAIPLTDVPLAPGQAVDISVKLRAPDAAGTYRGNWKFQDPEGRIFGLTTGGPIWVEIKVPSGSVSSTGSSSDYSGYPDIDIIRVAKDQTVTIKGKNFPANDQFNVVMNYYGTLGIDGIYVTSIQVNENGKFTGTFQIPSFLKGQSYIAVRLESPLSGYYAYNWFYNS